MQLADWGPRGKTRAKCTEDLVKTISNISDVPFVKVGGFVCSAANARLERGVDEVFQAARLLLLQARNANTGVDPTKVLALYRDVDPFGMSSVSRSGLVSAEPRWLSVDWFRNSSYSPTRLETHPHAHQHGSMWRAAFEDLLSAELDKPQFAHQAWSNRVNDQSLYASWAQHPSDWMLGLSCRGILPPQLPSLYNLPSTRHMDSAFRGVLRGTTRDRDVQRDFERLAADIAHFDPEERAEQMSNVPDTEADLYESFLGKANKDDKQVAPQQQAKVDVASSRILSTLSTTERTTLPDGSTTTKVMLRKRFADGREESTETVSTSHADISQNCATDLGSTEQQGKQGAEDKKKKGWFWS